MTARQKLIELMMDMPSGRSTYEEEERHMENVADYLIENGVTIQQWRSVTDEPPNEGEMILVCAGGQVGEAFLGYTGFRWANGFAIEKEVTHWMPLPEPPKGE